MARKHASPARPARLPDALWEYTKSCPFERLGRASEYVRFHQLRMPTGAGACLEKFLFATMDEVRLRHAEAYTQDVLRISASEDLGVLRLGMMRRELSKAIAYPKQRDHAAHTLHNYLLGWYLFSHSERLRREFERHFKRRGIMKRRPNPVLGTFDVEPGVAHWFGNVWPFVSLMHDVGYIYEGSLEPLEPGVQSVGVRRGAEFAREVFGHHFWAECGLSSAWDRERVKRLTGVSEPTVGAESITEVGATLRNLGDVGRLAVMAAQALRLRGQNVLEPLSRPGGLSSDAFDLWRGNYLYYGSPGMANRVSRLENAFRTLQTSGIPEADVRILDHGVCSGLLLLQYSTLYYRLVAGLSNDEPDDPDDRRLWAMLRQQAGHVELTAEELTKMGRQQSVVFDADWWWQAIVWETAATALHNIPQQFLSCWPGGGAEKVPFLSLEDDPLAYLGILVDVLQEWDRYTISHSAALSGAMPLQGRDVSLRIDRGKTVSFDFGDPERGEKVVRALNSCLNDWGKIVRVG